MKNLTKLLFCFSIFLASCTTIPVLDQSGLPKEFDENFIWGINGHPIWSHDYENAPLEQQISLLKEHQFDYYRIDVYTDSNGNVIQSKVKRFEELLKLAKKNNIKILPGLSVYKSLENIQFQITEDEAYDMGYKQAKSFLIKYSDFFDYYVLGNELDIKTILGREYRGISSEDYDLQKLTLVASYLRGMIDAIKKYDLTSQTVINSTGGVHFGFYEILDKLQVKFDIIGYHWYSKNNVGLFEISDLNVDVLSTFNKTFNKPIWITEINRYEGSRYNAEEEQAHMMELYLNNINNKNSVQAFFVYELYDQPHLVNAKWAGSKESYYGIVGWKSDPPDYSKYYYKPVSNVLKYKIEEAKNGKEDFIYAILFDLYKTQPNEEDLHDWASRLDVLNNQELVISEILENNNSEIYSELTNQYNPQESLQFIISVYQAFLKRNPAEKEIRYWRRALKKRVSFKDFIVKILLSEEYWEYAIWSGYEKRTGYKKP